MPEQFRNPANPNSHYRTTSRELMEQMNDEISCFVAGVGTGGTITGVGRLLKQCISGVRIVAVEPEDSAVLSGKQPGRHAIQGIGAGFVPEVLDRGVIDLYVGVSDDDAAHTCRRLAREEGLLLGISAGAVAFAAIAQAKQSAPGKNVVAIAPDSGERYLTSGVFSHTGSE